MKVTSRFLIIFVYFSITTASSNTDSGFYKSPLKDKNFKLQKINEFTLHDTSAAGNIIGKLRFTFATNRDASLHAFYDEIKRQFIITDNRGAIQQIISHAGRGPGEILKAGGFNFDDQDRLVVFDQNQLMLKVFDRNGSVINHANLGASNYPITGRKLQIYNGKIVASTMDRRLLGDLRAQGSRSKLAGVYTYKGTLVDTIGTYDPTVTDAKSYNIFSIINIDHQNGWLLGTQYHNYRVQMYNLNNKKRLAWFGRKTAHFKEGEEYISPNLPTTQVKKKSAGISSAVNIYPLKDYIILYFETPTKAFYKTDNFNDKKPYIVVYDNKSYTCYGEISLPYSLGNVAANRFYLIEDDNPDHFTVGIYKLEEKD